MQYFPCWPFIIYGVSSEPGAAPGFCRIGDLQGWVHTPRFQVRLGFRFDVRLGWKKIADEILPPKDWMKWRARRNREPLRLHSHSFPYNTLDQMKRIITPMSQPSRSVYRSLMCSKSARSMRFWISWKKIISYWRATNSLHIPRSIYFVLTQ